MHILVILETKAHRARKQEIGDLKVQRLRKQILLLLDKVFHGVNFHLEDMPLLILT